MSEPGGWWADTWAWISGFEAATEEHILTLTESAWIYPSVFGLSLTDAIVPVVPSESVVIATSTAWAQTGTPVIWLVWLAAMLGAWCGDQIAYTIGTFINVRRIPGMSSARGHALADWAEHALENRGVSFIIAARFVPGGRIAMNLTAGALRYPRRRFMGIDAVAAVIWATYGVALGLFAGSLFEGRLLFSVVVGVVGGVILGVIVDKALAKVGLEPPELPDLDDIPVRGKRKKPVKSGIAKAKRESKKATTSNPTKASRD